MATLQGLVKDVLEEHGRERNNDTEIRRMTRNFHKFLENMGTDKQAFKGDAEL